MQAWLVSLFIFTLILPVGFSEVHNDNLTNVVSACGKPKKDYTFPKDSSYHTRYLVYKGETLWFTEGSSGWGFQGWGRTPNDDPILGTEGAYKALPCLKQALDKVDISTAQPKDSTDLFRSDSNPNPSSYSGGDVLTVMLIIVGIVLYGVPIFVAAKRNVHAQGGIIALNLLLGWSIIGWVGSLIWALSAETEEHAKLREAALANLANVNK